MSNSDLVLDFLEEIHPGKFCDDCLSTELEIYPRQQINQICRKLDAKGLLSRLDANCASCGKNKKVNGKTLENISKDLPVQSDEANIKKVHIDEHVDLREIRKEIISICRKIWSKEKSEEPPHSPLMMINILKKEDRIPSHQANMMLTICGLRNSYEHDYITLGIEEKTIAKNAWKIIEKWNENTK